MTQFNLVEPLVAHGLSLVKTQWSKSRLYLPYVALYHGHKPGVPGNAILLNRRYKPLGINQSTHVDYLDPQFDYCRFDAPEDDEPDVKRVEGFGWGLWFYSDESSPRNSDVYLNQYLLKLHKVLATYTQRSGDE